MRGKKALVDFVIRGPDDGLVFGGDMKWVYGKAVPNLEMVVLATLQFSPKCCRC